MQETLEKKCRRPEVAQGSQPGNRLQPSTDKERNPIRTPSGHESGSTLPRIPLSLLCTQLTPPPHPDLPEKRHTQPTQESSAQLCDFCLQNDQPTRGLCFKRPDVWSFVMQIFLPADVVLFALSRAPQQETQAVYIFPRCQVRDQKLPTPSVSDRETNTSHLAACLVSHGKGRDLPLSWRLCWQGQQSCKHEPLTHQRSRKAMGQGL